MSFFMVDVEADGPCPGKYSMVSFGAVVVREGLEDTFYGQTRPLSRYHDDMEPVTTHYSTESLAVSGHSREEHLAFPDSRVVMRDFKRWIRQVTVGKPMFISDNNGFDWQWINYYFHNLRLSNPFGHSSTNLGSLYKGMEGSMFKNFKHLRETEHTHHPVEDATGNAEALLYMKHKMGLEIKLV